MSNLVLHLGDLADKINTEHAAGMTAARACLEHARNAGQLLLQAKDQCVQGQWLPWLAANVRFSERTAQAYMRVAKHWPEMEAKAQTTADLTIDEGLSLLAAPKVDVDDVLERPLVTLREVAEMFPTIPEDSWSIPELQRVIALAEGCLRSLHAIMIDNMTAYGEALRHPLA